MTSLTVPLPDPMKRFVEDEAAAAGFANPVDFVHDLICRAQRDKARKDLEAKLLEAVDALDRGEATLMKDEDWARLRSDYQRRHNLHSGA